MRWLSRSAVVWHIGHGLHALDVVRAHHSVMRVRIWHVAHRVVAGRVVRARARLDGWFFVSLPRSNRAVHGVIHT